jgi:hypothetical protein
LLALTDYGYGRQSDGLSERPAIRFFEVRNYERYGIRRVVILEVIAVLLNKRSLALVGALAFTLIRKCVARAQPSTMQEGSGVHVLMKITGTH